MLIPIAMNRPNQALKLAFYTTISSVLGGIVGFLVGSYLFEFADYYIQAWGYQSYWAQAVSWFERWGILVLFVAGFSPIPYKVFTICAGALQMAFFPFVFISLIARSARFVLVAKLAAWGGERFAAKLRQFIELIGWSIVVLAIIIYLILR